MQAGRSKYVIAEQKAKAPDQTDRHLGALTLDSLIQFENTQLPINVTSGRSMLSSDEQLAKALA